MKTWTRVALSGVMILSGCVSVGDNPNRKVTPPAASPDVRMLAGAVLPAIYRGDLPCADCAGIRYQLDIRADRVFFLRTTYLGKGTGEGETVDDIGTWTLAPDAQSVILRGSREPLRFSIDNSETLHMVDKDGKPIDSSLNYELKRNASYRPLEPHVSMRGMYNYLDNTAVFRECRTQIQMAVAPSAQTQALQRAYLEVRKVPGEELLVTLDGQIAMQPAGDGGTARPTLVVEQLRKVWSGASCETNVAE
jgi:copper homeostasis protein (lipoprotein)